MRLVLTFLLSTLLSGCISFPNATINYYEQPVRNQQGEREGQWMMECGTTGHIMDWIVSGITHAGCDWEIVYSETVRGLKAQYRGHDGYMYSIIGDRVTIRRGVRIDRFAARREWRIRR